MKSTTKSLLVLAAMLLIASAQPIATPAAEELPLPKELRDAEQRTWQQAPPATEADEAKPAEPTEPPADAPQPPAAEEPKPEKEQARRAWDWLKRVTGASSGDTPGKFERNHPTIKTAFRDAVAPAAHSVVQVQCNGKRRAMGTVVDSGGFVLTKASQLTGKLACRDAEGRQWDATVVGTLAEHDLAMLKIDTTELSAAAWDEGETPPVGSWLATPGAEATPLSIGVVSTASRSVFKSSALLGVVLEQTDDGPEVTQVLPDSGAEKAEVKQGDRIVKIDDQQVESREQLIAHIRGLRPGHQVKLTVQRGDEQLELTATLGKRPEMPQLDLGAFQNRLGGRLSRRRTDFPSVFQHDTVLRPDQCGGPVLDLDGKAVGVNIARAGRVASYAIPASVVVPLLDDLKSGKYAPAVQPEVAEQLDDLKAKIARLKKQLTEAKSAADESNKELTTAEQAHGKACKRLERCEQTLRQATAVLRELPADAASDGAARSQAEQAVRQAETAKADAQQALAQAAEDVELADVEHEVFRKAVEQAQQDIEQAEAERDALKSADKTPSS